MAAVSWGESAGVRAVRARTTVTRLGGLLTPASDGTEHDPSLRRTPKLWSGRARLRRAGLGYDLTPPPKHPGCPHSVCKWRNQEPALGWGTGMGHQALNPGLSDFRPFSSKPRVAIPPWPVSPSLPTRPGTHSAFSPIDELRTGELRMGPTIPFSRAWPGTVTARARTQRGGRCGQSRSPSLLSLRPSDAHPPGALSPQLCGASVDRPTATSPLGAGQRQRFLSISRQASARLPADTRLARVGRTSEAGSPFLGWKNHVSTSPAQVAQAGRSFAALGRVPCSPGPGGRPTVSHSPGRVRVSPPLSYPGGVLPEGRSLWSPGTP